jgi:molybdenum cofactor synthesis domain-containing protein
MERSPRVAVLVVSDRSFLALREDRAGPILTERIRAWGWDLAGAEVVPDDLAGVAAALRKWSDPSGVDLILTTGGTGLSPRDQTPEATLSVAERLAPGIQEWIRSRTGVENPHACLSRGVAVLRGRTLIVNLPGSPKAVTEYLDLLEIILPHALEQVAQKPNWGKADRHPGERV